MKILYSVQATGNGHISRAVELLPYLQKYGTVDIFLSGSNCHLQSDTVLPIKYRSKGLSLFYDKIGGLSYWDIIKKCSLINAFKDAWKLPVDKYDLVINDFESITSLACRIKGVSSIGFGHQASFMSDKSPRPAKRDLLGEAIFKYYAPSNKYIGLHFDNYDKNIYQPIIKNRILESNPFDGGYITVYLPHYSDEILISHFSKLKNLTFIIFSVKAKSLVKRGNVVIRPVENTAFTKSMINSYGVITGGGFETPAECLYLGKKLLSIPIKGQYEQMCNATALKNFNVPVLTEIGDDFSTIIQNWIDGPDPKKLSIFQNTNYIVEQVINQALETKIFDGEKYPTDITPDFIY